jgi:hypothetical protein
VKWLWLNMVRSGSVEWRVIRHQPIKKKKLFPVGGDKHKLLSENDKYKNFLTSRRKIIWWKSHAVNMKHFLKKWNHDIHPCSVKQANITCANVQHPVKLDFNAEQGRIIWWKSHAMNTKHFLNNETMIIIRVVLILMKNIYIRFLLLWPPDYVAFMKRRSLVKFYDIQRIFRGSSMDLKLLNKGRPSYHDIQCSMTYIWWRILWNALTESYMTPNYQKHEKFEATLKVSHDLF